MNTTYALMLIVSNIAGYESLFAVDTDLSLSDCMELLKDWEPTVDEYSSVYCAGELYVMER